MCGHFKINSCKSCGDPTSLTPSCLRWGSDWAMPANGGKSSAALSAQSPTSSTWRLWQSGSKSLSLLAQNPLRKNGGARTSRWMLAKQKICQNSPLPTLNAATCNFSSSDKPNSGPAAFSWSESKWSRKQFSDDSSSPRLTSSAPKTTERNFGSCFRTETVAGEATKLLPNCRWVRLVSWASRSKGSLRNCTLFSRRTFPQ